jgi:hypothetical protein
MSELGSMPTSDIASAAFFCQGVGMSYASSARITFANMLGTLDHLVIMAQNAGMTDDVLGEKLTEDMFPLELQFRVALNQVLLALNQVAGRSLPLEETSYQTLAAIRERIAAILSHVDQSDTSDWADPEEPVDLTLPNGVRFLMSSEDDIRDWIMPNFYFHVTMAYVLLRNAGLRVGKMDFLPHMAHHTVETEQ